MGDSKAAVGTRVEEARRAARRIEAEFRELSKARLVKLKTLSPARLARRGRDLELTDADQKELQNFIANRTRVSERRDGLLSKLLRWRPSKRRPFSFTKATIAANTVLLATVSLAGWKATPSEYVVYPEATDILVGDRTRPLEWMRLKSGTVVRVAGDPISDRSQPIRLWVEGAGYRSVIYYAVE